MIAKEALRGAIIGTELYKETEGCIELEETQLTETDIGENTLVFLNHQYEETCTYANKREGYIRRPKGVGNKEEIVKGEVLILLCSEVVLKLLRGDYERE